MLININAFNELTTSGYLCKQQCTDAPLLIWNYTPKCTFERLWNEHTTIARGLITTLDGTVHALSFRKFFNLGEAPGPTLQELPNECPVVTEKLDGFLGLSYWHEPSKQIRVASRGSFTNEYATWATEWLQTHNPIATHDVLEQVKYTYVFEILYPHRRIVVDKSQRFGLILIAAFDNTTGEEMSRFDLEVRAKLYHWPIVDAYHIANNIHSIDGKATLLDATHWIETANKLSGMVIEGFVLHYPSTNVRVKIKSMDYIRKRIRPTYVLANNK